MRLGIIGGGVVGKATARCFMEWAEVRVYDCQRELGTHGIHETMDCDLVFVCLPTPQKEGELRCYTDVIDTFLGSHRFSKTNLVIRSTVPIGYTRRAKEMYGLPNLIHSPEFLTARCSLTDACMPARNIIGVPKGSLVNDCSKWLISLYRERFAGVPFYVMSSDESEAVKLFVNGFFAVKVGYFNEVRTLADKLGLDWQRVMAGVLSDGRIAHSHTQVPGPDGKYGFGGECLPKDLASLVYHMHALHLNPAITLGAYSRNAEDRAR